MYKHDVRQQQQQRNVAMDAEMETDGEDEDDDGLEIPMEQLIDEMEDVGLEDEE